MRRDIVAFSRDEEGEWVAELSCGHRQHVRHRPPFQLRPWVVDAAGRAGRIGTPIECPLCDRGEPPPGESGGQGGDPACWAGLLCPECGAVLGADPHRDGCPAARPGGTMEP